MFRNNLTLALGLLLLSGTGNAQDLPDAPSVSVGLFPEQPFVVRSKTVGAAPAATRGWIDWKVADAPYWTSTFALAGTTVVNVEMTARCVEQHTCFSQIDSGASRGRLYAYTLPTNVALDILGYKLKERTRWWWVPQAVFTAGNLFSAGRSYGRIDINRFTTVSPSSSSSGYGKRVPQN